MILIYVILLVLSGIGLTNTVLNAYYFHTPEVKEKTVNPPRSYGWYVFSLILSVLFGILILFSIANILTLISHPILKRSTVPIYEFIMADKRELSLNELKDEIDRKKNSITTPDKIDKEINTLCNDITIIVEPEKKKDRVLGKFKIQNN